MSPPKYKLSYFDGKGLAEPIRWLLSYAGEEFEDVRFTRDQWPSIKPSKLYDHYFVLLKTKILCYLYPVLY